MYYSVHTILFKTSVLTYTILLYYNCINKKKKKNRCTVVVIKYSTDFFLSCAYRFPKFKNVIIIIILTNNEKSIHSASKKKKWLPDPWRRRVDTYSWVRSPRRQLSITRVFYCVQTLSSFCPVYLNYCDPMLNMHTYGFTWVKLINLKTTILVEIPRSDTEFVSKSNVFFFFF